MAGNKVSFLDVLNNKSIATAAGEVKGYKEIYLSPYEVKEAPKNTRKECKGIEQLADNFLLIGQQQPTILGRVNGEYRIADGHRRNLANILNVERGHKEYEKVKYFYKDMTEAMYELCLTAGNGFTQDLTPFEKMELAERYKKALIRLKEEDGVEFKGKMRDIVAEYLGESSTNIARMESINSNLISEAKEEFEKGTIGISAAYEASKLPKEEQKKIAEAVAAGEEVRAKEISEKVKELKQEKKAVSESDTKEKEPIEIPQNAPEKVVEPKIYKKGEPREAITHFIKCSSMFFEDAAEGTKKFELRFNDRDYRVGDILHMTEHKDGHNTNRFIEQEIVYILEEFTGLKDGYCILGVELLTSIMEE